MADYDRTASVADTILQQLGGRRALVMLGGSIINTTANSLTFKWPNKQRSKGNACKIELRPDDTYDMTFFNMSGSGAKKVKEFEMVYADQLAELFEKQTGWYLRMGCHNYDRSKVAAVSGIFAMLNYLVKQSGGVAWIQKAIEHNYDTDEHSRWDKDTFYRQGMADTLLDKLTEEARKVDLSSWCYEALRRANGYTEAQIEDFRSPSFSFKRKLVLEMTISGPAFSRYGTDEDSESFYDPEDVDSYVEVPEDDAFVDEDIRKFAKYMGGKDEVSEERRESEEFSHMDYYEYQTKIVFSQSAEELVRGSFGRLVDQAGQLINWTGETEPTRGDLVPDKSTLVVKSKRGEWPDTLKKGLQLEVLRGGNAREVLKLRVLRNVLYLTLNKKGKDFVLTDPADPDKSLVVTLT